MITNNLDDYSINEFEYGFLAETKHHDSGSFKIHIPKLMTFGRSTPTKVSRKFNKNIFINDAKCKVNSSGSVSTQNYVTVERHRDTSLFYEYDIRENINPGHKFLVHIMNNNLDDLWIMKSVRRR